MGRYLKTMKYSSPGRIIRYSSLYLFKAVTTLALFPLAILRFVGAVILETFTCQPPLVVPDYALRVRKFPHYVYNHYVIAFTDSAWLPASPPVHLL
ncbi:hypothetical protein D3C75_743970 [compost metagenome]